MAVLFILTILFFPAHAKYAPSVAQSLKRQSVNDAGTSKITHKSYFQKLLKMMKTTKWMFIVISCGIVHGQSFFNATCLFHFFMILIFHKNSLEF